MTTHAETPYQKLAEWVWATDVHASHRVPLLERAGRILDGHRGASAADRRELAARLERWRYQHLNERFGKMAPEDRASADALDTAANELAGRKPRPPRAARSAIFESGRDTEAIAEGAARVTSASRHPISTGDRRMTEFTPLRAPGRPAWLRSLTV